MNNRIRLRTVVMALAGASALACGSAPPALPAGTALDTQVLSSAGPRIPVGSIFAASDLDTLRAMVDVSDAASVQQLGGAPRTHDCMPPYTFGSSRCWSGQQSRAGMAYLAAYIEGGFCSTPGAPAVFASGEGLVLRIAFTTRSDCHINGSVALPSASLVAFPTGGLRAGLYRVSYLFQQDGDDYRSPATYLSIPGPASGTPTAMEAEASAALSSVIGSQRAGVFSIARVDGAQIGSLCGMTTAGPVELVTTESDASGGARSMTVTLAGSPPHQCAVNPI